jgi:hypothetical protein
VREIALARIEAHGGWDTDLHVGSVGLDHEDLRACFEGKQAMTRPDAEEFWLLVGCGWQKSQDPGHVFIDRLEEDDDLMELVKSMPFDRVLIGEWIHGRVVSWDRDSGWSVLAGQQF